DSCAFWACGRLLESWWGSSVSPWAEGRLLAVARVRIAFRFGALRAEAAKYRAIRIVHTKYLFTPAYTYCLHGARAPEGPEAGVFEPRSLASEGLGRVERHPPRVRRELVDRGRRHLASPGRAV